LELLCCLVGHGAEYAAGFVVCSSSSRRPLVTDVCFDWPAMTTTPTTAPPSGAAGSRSADVAAFVAGALAAALGIALSELIAGLVVSAPSLVIAIGDTVIENQPPGAKELIVELFGSNNKLALNVGIVIATLVIAGLLGVAGRRNWTVPLAGFAVAGLVGLGAALTRPLIDPLLAVITVTLVIAAALAALRLMLRPTNPAWAAPSSTPAATEGREAAAVPAEMPDWDRRRFLQVGGGVAVGSVLLGLLGRNLLTQRESAPLETAELPTPAAPLPQVPAAASLDVEGITPIVVPTEDFYRIDTALVTPRVDVDDWTLRIHGHVDREVSLTYEDLLEMPLFEQYVTIACVSNKVGDDLIGNALWTGVDLRSVLDMAGVRPDGEQIVGRSVDGFTAGFPTAWAMDPDRRPMIAIGMNGQPLPQRHGYPARLIIPGLYGYVSATKWLKEIELTGWDEFDGYWIPRGWAKEAPILTQSRIDTPRQNATVLVGTTVPIGGVAWAPDRGVRKVEVAIDGGEWQGAQISDPLNDATWVQWVLPWDAPAEPGEHELKVRATDGTGEVQTADITPPAPDGARGHHTIRVSVA
jgi:DMSO/TMAO reductase YedYZ molybdopterin-dependent catalytic subunit